MSRYIEITRIFDAPRERVYRAFTDPDQLAQWLGPAGCRVPRDSIEADVRAGGHLRFMLTGARLRSRVDLTFTEAVANALPAGEIEAVPCRADRHGCARRMGHLVHQAGRAALSAADIRTLELEA